MTETIAGPADYDLRDRYRAGHAPVVLTGVQAIARLLVEQHERERAAGRRTATFVSGYQGSPLAGLDKTIAGTPELAAEHDVRLVPGLNEELGVTAVWGSQQELPGETRTHDGVVGVWYGKAPGVDRSADALRHGNMYGAHPTGGVVVLAGDDPGCKSSTLPSATERTLASMEMPVLYPRNAEEVITFGLHAIALSRTSGCFVALKIVADVADGVWTVDRDFGHLDLRVPAIEWDGRPWTYRQLLMKDPRDGLVAETQLLGPRWAMVRAFLHLNSLDAVEVDPPAATVGLVAAGTAYDALRQALTELGLSDADLHAAGLRILRLGSIYPVDEERIRDFARGLEQVVVVEDKVAFVETQIREALYGLPAAPRVLGKRDEQGRPLVPADGELVTARLVPILRRVLAGHAELRPERPATRVQLPVLPLARTAYFCSGCPHNRSTVVPDGSLASGGIGCHTMVTMAARPSSEVTGLTQMGGEGALWIGQSTYTDVNHVFQNVGDGTFYHSGQLALQACVAAGVNITYKILYNSGAAMTGAQEAQGALGVPALTHKLRADGVARVIVCADEVENYRGRKLAPGVVLWHRDRLDEAQRILREVPGVTALIYDSRCAADARRLRKRGRLPERPRRVVINEMVCEGCGDCGVQSNCLSVQPVDTEYGRKTRIDQNSCNTDYSCLNGDCPSFMTLTAGPAPRPTGRKRGTPPAVPDVAPADLDGTSWNVFLAGIGGTGIVTVNQILATAAMRAGLVAKGLDQTGLSQKAGPVTSHLRLAAAGLEPSNRVTPGATDCVLAFDLLVAADGRYLGYGDRTRTVTVASTSATPTGDMVYDPAIRYPDEADLLGRLETASRRVIAFDALDAAEALLGGTAAANFLLIGAAYQASALPIPAAAIEDAIRTNGVAVDANIAAFRWGRAAVAAPDAFQRAIAEAKPPADAAPAPSAAALLAGSPLTGDIRDRAERRAAQLVRYQGPGTARRYLRTLHTVWAAERRLGRRTEFSAAVADGLHRFIAYKDEYEVARLLTDPALVARARAEVPGGENLTYHLHPPILRALGLRRKIRLTPKSHVVLRALAIGRKLRGTPLDPFGYAQVRRVERALRDHYEAMVVDLAAQLSAGTYDTAVTAAAAADIVRGYEHIKLGNVRRYREKLASLALPASTPALPPVVDTILS
ncbi:indolepyruvate ferredoxin oxidoreductase family protein [Actinoplanes sp. NPDC049265]|uniref:indolepyruvate ferredoxin oxidoreductase family protein n=1 Tax=Actinoplanes sp. NPDC049265 TaxID=3363902 RepID=UPI00371A8F04